MATVPINQSASASNVAPQQPPQGATGFPSELQAMLSLADIPDPGGGPPPATAEGKASNLGPNAQSNQPDFLPLLETAGVLPQPVGAAPLGGTPVKGAKTNLPDATLVALAGVVNTAVVAVPVTPPAPAETSQIGEVSLPRPALVVETAPQTITFLASPTRVSSPASGSTPAPQLTPDKPTMGQPVLTPVGSTPTPATVVPTDPSAAAPPHDPSGTTAVVTLSPPTASSAPTAPPAPPVQGTQPAAVAPPGPAPVAPLIPTVPPVNASPVSPQTNALVQSAVAVPVDSRTPLPPAAVRNAGVSAMTATNSAPTEANTPIAATSGTGDQPQDFSGNTGSDHPSNQPTAAPDPTAPGTPSTFSIPGQTAPVTPNSPVEAISLSTSERVDVVRQVADRIELMVAARPQQGVTIHLQPHGLGDVTILVKGIGKDIDATFSASNPAVRSALADSRDALTQAVTAKGYNLVGVNIAAHSQSMTGRDRQSSPNQQQSPQAFGNSSNGGAPNGTTNSRGAALPAPASTSTETEEDVELALTGAGGVDYRI